MTWRRYQLEAFVDKVKGRTPQTWVDAQDTIDNMKWIEEIYAKVSMQWFHYMTVDVDSRARMVSEAGHLRNMCLKHDADSEVD